VLHLEALLDGVERTRADVTVDHADSEECQPGDAAIAAGRFGVCTD
jgi:hypothetical protein